MTYEELITLILNKLDYYLGQHGEANEACAEAIIAALTGKEEV